MQFEVPKWSGVGAEDRSCGRSSRRIGPVDGGVILAWHALPWAHTVHVVYLVIHNTEMIHQPGTNQFKSYKKASLNVRKA